MFKYIRKIILIIVFAELLLVATPSLPVIFTNTSQVYAWENEDGYKDFKKKRRSTGATESGMLVLLISGAIAAGFYVVIKRKKNKS